MTTSIINELVKEKIISYLTRPGSHYFTVETVGGEFIKIRVSDHSANADNNGNQRTLSFVSARSAVKRMGQCMITEYLILDNGLTDTYEEIIDILSDYEIVEM